jgi:LysM repeat protein
MNTHHPFGRRPVLIPVLVTVLMAGLFAYGLVAAPTAEAGPALQEDPTLAIIPADVTLACDQTARVDIRINNVEDLYGIDVKVSFDADVVEVVDANASMPGVQVSPGNMPDVAGGQGLVQVNSVDVSGGTISYAAIRLNPAAPQSGSGIIASVTFKGKGTGTGAVEIVSGVLSDQTARPIAAELVGGQIVGTCSATPAATAAAPATATAVPGATAAPTVPVPPTACTHAVRPGDTLYSIARNYGATVDAIMTANGITNANLIYAGQTLTIPGCRTQPTTSCSTHTVVPGDTLTSIALVAGDCTWGLAQRNHIANPDLIFVGQVLTVCPGCGGGQPPSPGGCRSTHTVLPGETLYRIAYTSGTTVPAVQAANNIVNPNLVYAGQVLCIP